MSCAAARLPQGRSSAAVPAVLVALALIGSSLPISPARATDSSSKQLDHIYKLLNASSAARSVQGSDKPEVASLYAQAQALYEQAAAAAERGDVARRDTLLDEAAKTMFAAVRLVDTPIHDDKSRRDFSNRRNSIEALADAYQRVAAEKGQQGSGVTLQQRISSMLDAADSLLAAGDSNSARAQLDAAYVELRGVLSKMRDGDTLVHALEFEGPEDEYLYELDRNDTHRMLARMMLAEKLDDPATKARVTPFIEAAANRRAAAESQATDRKFEDAVALLDASTREYVKALRAAGIYIPG